MALINVMGFALGFALGMAWSVSTFPAGSGLIVSGFLSASASWGPSVRAEPDDGNGDGAPVSEGTTTADGCTLAPARLVEQPIPCAGD